MNDVVLVDEETGESLERAALRGNCLLSTLNFTDPEYNNLETGEPEEATLNHLSRRRVPFQIPRALQRQDGKKEEEEEEDNLRVKKIIENNNYECSNIATSLSSRFNNKNFGNVKNLKKTEPFGETNPIMLCIPMIFYFRWVIAIIMIFEVFFHVWAHHKNKYLKNADVYFRSPFHSITSEFCAHCQSENCMDRVGKIQAIRAGKFLRQCNYMKRVVT